MAGVKTARQGFGGQQKFYYERGTNNKLTHVLLINNGKRAWSWAVRDGDDYRYIDNKDIELR